MYTISTSTPYVIPGTGAAGVKNVGEDYRIFKTYNSPAVWTTEDYKSGESVPNWREKLSRGEFAASPYTRKASKVHAETCKFQSTWGYPDGSYASVAFSGLISSPVLPAYVPVDVTVDNKALQRILDRIRAEYEHINVLPAIGELQQTIRMFGAPFSSIISLTNRRLNKLHLEWRGLKGSVAFKRIKWERIIASSYLEYAFGLKPLIEDTRSVAEAFARWNAEADGELPRATNLLLRASAEAKERNVTHGTVGAPLAGVNWVYSQRVDEDDISYSVRYLVQLRNSVQGDFGTNERLMQLLGFSPMSFIPTLWEVLPWSWLVDYFANVQQIIEAGVTATSNVSWVVRSQRSQIKRVQTHVTSEGMGDFRPSNHLGRYNILLTDFRRSLPGSLGVPSLVLGFPNSVTKFANMTAALFSRRSHAQSLWLF